jgi:hypothetical protein
MASSQIHSILTSSHWHHHVIEKIGKLMVFWYDLNDATTALMGKLFVSSRMVGLIIVCSER